MKNGNNNQFTYTKIFLIYLIMLILKIIPIVTECYKNKPFIKNDECVDSCTQEELESKECEISYSILKTQWLTNIISIGEKNFRYVKIATFSNNDIIISTHSSSNNKRIFYGLKENGRFYFTQNSNETPYYTFEIDDSTRNEAELFVIKLNEDNEKEYLISIANGDGYIELYDFKNNNPYIKKTSEIFSNLNTNAIRSFSLSYKISNKYYNLFGCLHQNNSYQNAYIYELNFNTINSIKNDNIISNSLKGDISIGYGISCDKIDTSNSNYTDYKNKKLFMCAYLYNKEPNLATYTKYYIFLIDENFNIIITKAVSASQVTSNTFFKLVYLDGVNAIFSYFLATANYPKVDYEKFEIDPSLDITRYLSIYLSKYLMNNYMNLNDLIKINSKMLCYISTEESKETILIIIIEIFYDNTYNHIERYYKLEMFKFHNFKLFKDISAHLYNNYITLATSYCKTSSCSSDSDEYYSSLMIFSYPNATDINISLEEYLLNHDYITMDNLTLAISENIWIENNIFGNIYYGYYITNIKISNNIELKMINDESQEVSSDIIIEKDNLKINFLDDNNKLFICEIWYRPRYTESDYNNYMSYPTYIDGVVTDYQLSHQTDEYFGRETLFNLTSIKEITNNCENKNCIACYSDSKSDCFKCKTKNFTIEIKNDIKIMTCYDDEKEKENEEENENENEEEEKKNENENQKLCTNDEVINNLCNKNMTNKQVSEVYNKIIDEYLKQNETETKIIQTENVIFEIIKYDNQPILDNISNIDLKECEKILKKQYNIKEEESLIIIKTDMKNDDSISTYVHYKIFSPYTLEQLDLKYCIETKISILVPINLNNETRNLYKSLNESGYNLFDTSDSFYTDICTPYTTLKGSDIIIEDRKKDIYNNNGNISICQSGCEFISYNSTNNKANCDCSVIEEEEPDLNKISFNKNLVASSFKKTISNSNFRVMECYELIFSKKGEIKNYGNYIMIFLLICVIASLVIYCFKGPKFIKNEIDSILKYKEILQNSDIKNKKIKQKIPDKKVRNSKKRISAIVLKKNINIKFGKNKENKFEVLSNKKILENNNVINKKINNNYQIKNTNHPPKKSIELTNSNFTSSKSRGILINRNSSPNIIRLNMENKEKSEKSKKYSKIFPKKFKQNFINGKNEIQSESKNNIISGKILKNIRNLSDKNNYYTKLNNLNDEELNTLSYKKAIELDKRTYFQYYWGLLKKKQLILFAFIVSKDYNIRVVKIALLIVSFSLYFTINGFFFTDSSMHKIYKNNGKFNFVYQIPQIIYSFLVAIVINTILRQLSLSEKDILSLKKEKDFKQAKNKSEEIRKCILLKFYIFFGLSIILMILFWYFITCFCAVYTNTQYILIKNTLISFGLFMLFPFGFYLIPGLFRISALQAKRKNKRYLYTLGNLIAYF